MNHLFLLRTNVASGEYLPLRQSSAACLWSSLPAPRSINLEPFGQEFSVQVSHFWEWEACFGATYQSLAPASQSSRRGYNLRVRFQQNRSVYTVFPAVRYLHHCWKIPCFSHLFQAGSANVSRVRFQVQYVVY